MRNDRFFGPAIVSLATIVVVFCGFHSAAQADLLLYEPFDYTVGELLDGQTPPDGMGMTGSWTAWDSNGFDMKMADGPRDPFQWRSWDGVAHNVAQTGNFISLGFDGRAHVRGMVTMDSSVTDTFTSEAVTWMSMVAAQGDVPWGFWPLLAIGAGDLIEDRGNKAADQAIGGGGYYDNGNGPVGAHYWNDEDANGTFEIHPSATLAGFSYPAELLVLKITWDDPLEDGKDKIQAFQFDVNEGAAVPTEEAFELGAVGNSADLDQSLFTTLSYGGGRIELDEIRLGTTFDDILTGTEVGSSTVELAWQSSIAADWTSPNWLADGGATLVAPVGGEILTVDSDTGPVNVTTDLTATPAASLSIAATAGATVDVSDTGTLAVTGDVTVGANGQLTVDGTLTAASASVAGKLGGKGTINVGAASSIVVTGNVAPGNDGNRIGTLTLGSGEMRLDPAATFEAQVSLAVVGPDQIVADQIEVSAGSLLMLGGTL
ncbi:MAG: polymer-forming cytoskeletal protein, partial [Candidatus Nealsonbacteria bacterium]|nr:polymer-forming cytoskeletal protein [Candidatus Nealsonbacteria bacterium]